MVIWERCVYLSVSRHPTAMSNKVCKYCEINLEKQFETEFYDLYECPTCNRQKAIKITDCCRNPNKIVITYSTKKSKVLLKQCKGCGGVVNKNLPLKSKIFGSEIADEFNEYKYEEWENAVLNDYSKISGSINNSYYNASIYGQYDKYINSDNWKKSDVRLQKLKIANYICEVCNENSANEVHHKTYENFKNEKAEDLLAICTDCHEKITRESRNSRYNAIINKNKDAG